MKPEELNNRINLLADNCAEQFRKGEERFDTIIRSINENTEATRKLSEAVIPIVEIHRDVQGVANLGVRVQKLGLWVAKWPLIGGALYVIYTALIKFTEQL